MDIRAYISRLTGIFFLSIVCIISLFTAKSVVHAQGYTCPSNPPIITYYVSTTGNDNNPGTFSQPFLTLNKARDVVRTDLPLMCNHIYVYLRGGTYPLTSTFTLTSQDSGVYPYDVIYRNYSNEVPVLTGGIQVSGWTQEGSKWKAQVGTSVDTRQLYVNGVRAIRAKSTGGLAGGVKTAGGYTTTDMNMQNWGNKDKIEMVDNKAANEPGESSSRMYRCPVSTISGGTITMQNPCWSDSQLEPNSVYRMGLPDWIENAYELLDSPGEWYLNRSTGWLYYMPRTGEDMTTATVVMPTVEKLVSLEGTLSSLIKNIRFIGITFSYGTWLAPNTSRGNTEMYANVAWRYINGSHVAEPALGNFSIKAGQYIRLENNVFKRLGGDAISIEYGSRNNTIKGNHICDVSGNAVQSGSGTNAESDSREITQLNVISNNYIHNIGVEYFGGVGISSRIVQWYNVNHNEVEHVPSGGILTGWHMDPPPSYSNHNRIERNLVNYAMEKMYDGGSIYVSGSQPYSIAAYNVVKNQQNEYGALYSDLNTLGIEWSNNVSVDNVRNGFFNGSYLNIHDNWWQYRYDHKLGTDDGDVWLYQVDLPTLTFTNNHNIDTLSQAPSSIVNSAGLETAYQFARNEAP